MKVGLLTTGFPRFEGDHCGAFVATLAKGLAARGCEVRVLAPEPRRGEEPPRWHGIEVTWVPYARPRRLQTTFYGNGAPENLRRRPARLVGGASFTAALLHAARSKLSDCDALVSSWCVPAGLVASTVANGRDHLCICHATDVRWLSHVPFGGAAARRIVEGATSMWFLSAALRERFLHTAGLNQSHIPTHVGPMPIEPAGALREGRATLRKRLGMESFTLLYLGRLVRLKGVDVLLRAAAGVRQPLEIRIAGDGPERRRLTRLARDLGIRATFEGWVWGERKEALLRASDALVVPSREGDGLPTVVFEARARGLFVIASQVGAMADFLEPDDQTTLVAPDEPGALRRAIDALHAERASRSFDYGATRSVPRGGR